MNEINSISPEGWGRLLKVLFPTSGWLLFWDVFLFFVVPVGILLGLVTWQKKRFNSGVLGVWCAAGQAWRRCFWLSLALMVGVYLLANEILTTNISGVVSFKDKYQYELAGLPVDSKLVESDRVRAGVARCWSASAKLKNSESVHAPEYRVVAFFCRRFGYIHPLLFTMLDMALLGWFFWPGFKMLREKIRL